MNQPIPPNIALVGCGAIAQAFYLPAMSKHRARFGNVWLVDPSEHALSGADSTMSGRMVPRLADVTDDLQAVIVATPNSLHYPIALEALSRGAHVLLEKPFVIWPEEGCALVESAAAGHRVLAVNQTRRLHPLAGDLRKRIRADEFGALVSVVHHEGTKLGWPFESGAGFARGAVRTGVVMDFGVHVLDFYHYLLRPEWSLVSATHDGFSGPEGLAEIALEADGAPVSLRLSRYYPQENVAHMKFERADVSFGVYDDQAYSVRSSTGTTAVPSAMLANTDGSTAAERLLLNFLAACEGRESPICDAASSLPVIAVLDEIYRDARRYPATLGSV